MKVFDLGGHVGGSYYAYKKYLTALEHITWQVCDVAAVDEAGKRMANENAEKKCKLPFQASFPVQPYQGLYFRMEE